MQAQKKDLSIPNSNEMEELKDININEKVFATKRKLKTKKPTPKLSNVTTDETEMMEVTEVSDKHKKSMMMNDGMKTVGEVDEIVKSEMEETTKQAIKDHMLEIKTIKIDNTTLDLSVKKSDYHFSMKQFLSSKCEYLDTPLQKFKIYFDPHGDFIYADYDDIYGGKQFNNKHEFWLMREQMAAKFVMSRMKIRTQMKSSLIREESGITTWLTDQRLSYDMNSLKPPVHDRIVEWIRLWKNFYYSQSYNNLASIYLNNNAVLPIKSVTCFEDQTLFDSAVPAYIAGCMRAVPDIYNTYAPRNLATNMWTMRYDNTSIVSEKNIGITHQPALFNDELFTHLSSRVPGFDAQMYMRLKTLVDDTIKVESHVSTDSVKAITNNLNLVLTNISTANTIPSSIFSANVQELLSTLVSGCVMSDVYKLSYDTVVFEGLDLVKVVNILSYLMYIPSPLIDPLTVDNMKSYLYSVFMGAYKLSNRNNNLNVKPFKGFDANQPNILQNIFAMTFGAPIPIADDSPLNFLAPTWADFLNLGIGGPIFDFFNHRFGPRARVNGQSICYEGVGRYQRFSLVTNFLLAVTAFDILNNAMTSSVRGNFKGTSNMFRDQYLVYSQFTLYLTNVTNKIEDMRFFSYTTALAKVDLDLNYMKLFALTAKMGYFDAGFKNTMYKVYAWSDAVRVELSQILILFRKYWENDSYYADVARAGAFVKKSDLRKFIEQIVTPYRSLFTTDIALWVFDNISTYMRTDLPFVGGQLGIQDLYEFDDLIESARADVFFAERQSGYRFSVAYNCLNDVNAGRGLLYNMSAITDNVAIVSRREFLTLNTRLSSVITSSDDTYPCFRIRNNFINDVDFYPIQKDLLADIREGNKLVDIPAFTRWTIHQNEEEDFLITNPPLFMPIEISDNPLFEINNLQYLNDGTPANSNSFINNSTDDFIFTGSDNFDTFFHSIRIF